MIERRYIMVVVARVAAFAAACAICDTVKRFGGRIWDVNCPVGN